MGKKAEFIKKDSDSRRKEFNNDVKSSPVGRGRDFHIAMMRVSNRTRSKQNSKAIRRKHIGQPETGHKVPPSYKVHKDDLRQRLKQFRHATVNSKFRFKEGSGGEQRLWRVLSSRKWDEPKSDPKKHTNVSKKLTYKITNGIGRFVNKVMKSDPGKEHFTKPIMHKRIKEGSGGFQRTLRSKNSVFKQAQRQNAKGGKIDRSHLGNFRKFKLKHDMRAIEGGARKAIQDEPAVQIHNQIHKMTDSNRKFMRSVQKTYNKQMIKTNNHDKVLSKKTIRRELDYDRSEADSSKNSPSRKMDQSGLKIRLKDNKLRRDNLKKGKFSPENN